MNVMNDERFFDLAMKVIAEQATAAEHADLDAAVAGDPARKVEFERWRAQAGLAREVLPLLAAVDSTQGELPAYVRGRLQTKVRQTLGRPVVAERKRNPLLVWFLALAPVSVAVVLLLVFFNKPAEPMIQVAMLDTTGGTRGAVTNEMVLLKQQWWGSAFQAFEKASDLSAWEKEWPKNKGSVAKVIFDPATAEVRLLLCTDGKLVDKVFSTDQGLEAALRLANDFIKAQGK
jgi:hypothetical protein